MLSVKPTAPITTTSIGLLIAGHVRYSIATNVGLTLHGDESLDRLQEYAYTQRKQEHAVEKGAEQGRPLPAIGKRYVWIFPIVLFGYLV
jgi:hypothetical protein